MAKKGSQSASKKMHYADYPSRAGKNRVRRLERHLKAHPEDSQAATALKKGPQPRGAKKRIGKGVKFPVLIKRPDGTMVTELRNLSRRASKPELDYLRDISKSKKAAKSMNYMPSKEREAYQRRLATFEASLSALKTGKKAA